MDRRESLHGNLDACIKSALPLPLIKECQYLDLTPFCNFPFAPIPRSGERGLLQQRQRAEVENEEACPERTRFTSNYSLYFELGDLQRLRDSGLTLTAVEPHRYQDELSCLLPF